MLEQVRLCTVCRMENWLGSSKTTYRVGWMIWICYSRALERRYLGPHRRSRSEKFSDVWWIIPFAAWQQHSWEKGDGEQVNNNKIFNTSTKVVKKCWVVVGKLFSVPILSYLVTCVSHGVSESVGECVYWQVIYWASAADSDKLR